MRLKGFLNFKRIFAFLPVTLLLLGLWFPPDLFCQNPGFKYLKNYTPNEYEGQDQNWAILQDKHGIIYVGNQGGLLEFDGVSWRLIQIPNDSVHSLAMDDNGTIYLGGENQIGFLSLDLEKGALKYMSLLNYLDDNCKDFSIVWRTHAAKDGIYFLTSKYLFRWDPASKKIETLEPSHQHQFNASFMCDGKLYVHQEKVGLMSIKNDSLTLLPKGDKFADVQIYMLASYHVNKLLIGTWSKGFYLYDGKTVKPFHTKVVNYLKQNEFYHGIRLSSGDFALATLQGGLVIIDPRGRKKEIFNKPYGLQDNDVRYVFEDSQGNLWLGLNSGISKIEYTSPFSVYDDRADLPGRVLSVIKYQNQLYAGTNSGLYSFAFSDKFTPVRGIPGMCWCLLSMGDSLLVATTTYGVFQVVAGNKDEINTNGIPKVLDVPSYVLVQSQTDSNRVWVGTAQGLVSLYPKTKDGKHQWEIEHNFKDIPEEIRTIVEDKKGNLWLGTLTKGILRVDFPDKNNITKGIVTRYTIKQELPPGNVNVYRAAGHIMFASGKGIYRFDGKTNRFIPDGTLGDEFAGGSENNVFYILEDKNKNIWFHSQSMIHQVIPGQGGNLTLYSIPFRRITATNQVNTIYPDPGGKTIWFGGSNGLFRYDITVKKNYRQDYRTLIRKIRVNDTLFFDGYKGKTDRASISPFPVFKYRDRNLYVEFASTFFEAEAETQYRCFLEGYDKDWTPWSKETKKNYINLDSGVYTFRVRAKNIYQHQGDEDVFRFKILPPWYKTWLAFLIFAMVFFLFMFLIIKWRSWKLVKEKQILERAIKERTKEINEKNQQLEIQTIKLTDQSEKLKEMDQVKSRFFANISHEFRTPLTLIMSPLEKMLSDSHNEKQKKELNVMLRNSQRLLTLINQLLDLSRIDSGKMKLQTAFQNIVPYLKGILASFHMLAQKNELELEFHAEEENIFLSFDAQKIEEVMYNLLINAIKFTPAGGKITVAVSMGPMERQGHSRDGGSPPDSVKISVRDTGIGIAQEQLVHIFDRFYQAKIPRDKAHKGTGIGLAFTKEIVALHQGKIDVHSQEGKWTEFVIRLPMENTHLKPGEIATTSETPSSLKQRREVERLYMIEEEDETAAVKTDIEPEIIAEEEEKNIILVVEDNAEVRKYIRGPLEQFYTVVEAADGKEGIDKAKEIIPDLIVSDIMMPEVDGYELCKKLKKDVTTSHVPIILLTAKASEESIIQGLETGADDYITKPFNTNILLSRIKNLIDLRRQLQLKIQRQKMMVPHEISVSSTDEKFLKEFQEIIEKNLSDEDFNVDILCKKLWMSRPTLFRKIQALTGETPGQFIHSYRLKRAAQLLRENFGNVTEVAMEVGFSSPQYFAKLFKEKFHQSPSSFKASEVSKQ